jgi:hypothetical protein
MEPLTHSVEVRAFPTDEQMNRAMQRQVDEIYQRILAADPLAGTFDVYEAARNKVGGLKDSQSRLSARARFLFEALRESSAVVESALIEGRAEPAAVSRLIEIENEHRMVMRANSRILEHLLPQAEIEELERAADHLSSKAAAVRAVALERIHRTAELMAEAAEYEGGIVFDPVKTLSGELQIQAAEFERQAANYRRWAEERRNQYTAMSKQLASIEAIRG